MAVEERAKISVVLQRKLVERHARCNDMAVEGAMQLSQKQSILNYRLETWPCEVNEHCVLRYCDIRSLAIATSNCIAKLQSAGMPELDCNNFLTFEVHVTHAHSSP